MVWLGAAGLALLAGTVFPALYFTRIAPHGVRGSLLWLALAAAWCGATAAALMYAVTESLIGPVLYCLSAATLVAGWARLGAGYSTARRNQAFPGVAFAEGRYYAFAVACALALLPLQLAPLPLSQWLGEACTASYSRLAESVVAPALEAYRHDHGRYPSSRMTDLVPAYLPRTPWVPCVAPLHWVDPRAGLQNDGNRLGDFLLGPCAGDNWVLYSYMVPFPRAYNLTTRLWSDFDPMDGYPCPPPD